MKAIRFITKISRDGIIKVPANAILFGEEAEVIILLRKDAMERKKNKSALDFIEKWSGYLISEDDENNKLDYLSEKYK